MGDVAEMMLEGFLCQTCGAMVDGQSPGYPRNCRTCARGRTLEKPRCTVCGRAFKVPQGLADHMKDKHGVAGQKGK